MASYTLPPQGGLHKTLTSTTADTITPTNARTTIQIYAWASNTNPIYARADGTTAVSAADGTTIIPPGGWYDIDTIEAVSTTTSPGGPRTISIVGNGDKYSIQNV